MRSMSAGYRGANDDGPANVGRHALVFVVVVLVSLSILSLVGLLLHFFASPPVTIKLRGQEARQSGQAFTWKGIALGSDPATVRLDHPGLVLSGGRNGLRLGTAGDKGTSLKVSFLDSARGGKAYRVQSTETLPTLDMNEVLAPLVKVHGRPISRSCREEPLYGARECEVSWWLQDVTRLEVTLRIPVPPRNPPGILMVATATNTYLEGLALWPGMAR
ncbi:MAG: hypothetical protein H7841_06635 [Magnetospirillum sp. WYHS-4]